MKGIADVECVRRLAVAATELHAGNVERNQVATKLLSGSWRNPYSNVPFTWNELDNAIVFVGKESGESGIHKIYY